MRSNYEVTILQQIASTARYQQAKPLLLGGYSSTGGGVGSPPGGFIGYLPQSRVAGDLSELSVSGLPASGITLLDNLNNIRYRISSIEGASGSPIAIYENGSLVTDSVSVLNFEGDISVGDVGGGEVTVTVSGTSGPTIGTFLDLTDTPTTYSGYEGNLFKVNGLGTGIEFLGTEFPASDVSITDGGGYYIGTSVEAVLQEVGESIEDILVSSTPGGSDTQIQYNDNDVLGADSGFTYNKTKRSVTIGDTPPYTIANNKLMISGGSTGSAGILMTNVSETQDYAPYISPIRARGAWGATTKVLDGDTLFKIRAVGTAETNYNTGATFRIVANGDYEYNVNSGAKYELWACPVGSVVEQLIATFDENGIDVNSGKITNLGEPDDDTDAATKKYVDDNAGGTGYSYFNRILQSDLSLEDGENLVVSEYVYNGEYDIILAGDSVLHVL